MSKLLLTGLVLQPFKSGINSNSIISFFIYFFLNKLGNRISKTNINENKIASKYLSRFMKATIIQIIKNINTHFNTFLIFIFFLYCRISFIIFESYKNYRAPFPGKKNVKNDTIKLMAPIL